MAQTLISLLLLRRLTLCPQGPISQLLTARYLSTAETPPSTPKPSSLSARLSFVFDQIDTIEKERSEKDHTLQRIRAWRESKKTQIFPQQDAQAAQAGPHTSAGVDDSSESGSAESKSELINVGENSLESAVKEVELVHPWPEWIELMERLVQQNYFDHRRKDEDKMIQGLGFDAAVVADEVGFNFAKDFKTVQTACLNFGKDRFDILRSLSRQDIQLLVGFGCPSVDKKVVFSAKLLRKHTHLDEGDVCSSCSLRNSCERAYLLTNKEDEARTIDLMRVLLTFGFDPLNGLVINKSLLKQKSIKTVVRKLLHEVVKLSSIPIDPNLPPPVIKKPPPKVKQPPPPPKKRVGRDDIEMKKGDWLCPKCDFMNFAKNTVCLQCDAKRPKRQLLPGEWECPECNFLNYRRNMVCFHCECKRPPDGYVENKMKERHGPRARLDKVSNRPEVSNAWNFDFDDNESDGAEVATFEYADSHAIGEDTHTEGHAQVSNLGRPEGNFRKSIRTQRVCEGEYADSDVDRPRLGFNDFDDEDDIDSYELETEDKSLGTKAWSNHAFEGKSRSEDFEGADDELVGLQRSRPKNSNTMRSREKKNAFSGSEDDDPYFDSDQELPINYNWKASHVADARPRGKGPVKLSCDPDEEIGLYSDEDDDFRETFSSRQKKGHTLNSGKRHNSGRAISDIEDGLFSGSDSGRGGELRGKKSGTTKRGNQIRGPMNYNSSRDRQLRPNGVIGSRKDSFNDFSTNDKRWRKKDDAGGDWRQSMASVKGGFRKQQHGRGSGHDMDVNRDMREFRNSGRVIER